MYETGPEGFGRYRGCLLILWFTVGVAILMPERRAQWICSAM
jgi:hypothetical protein